MEYNLSYGIIGFALVIPVILYYLIDALYNKRFLRLFLMLFIGFGFSKGILQILGFITYNQAIMIMDLMLYSLFIHSLFARGLKFLFLKTIVWFVLISLFSWIINDVPLFSFIMFLRMFLYPFIVFYTLLNISLSKQDVSKIVKLVYILSFLQIVIALVKFGVIGIAEAYIGTMSARGGSMTTVFSLLTFSYSFLMYFHTKKKLYIWSMIGFFLFSISGDKRATAFYLIPIILFSFYYYQKQFTRGFNIVGYLKYLPIILLFIAFVFYSSIRLLPSLNKEHVVWGSFDMDYVLDYTNKYNNTNSKTAENYGRGEAPMAVLRLISNKGKLLYGLGAGDIMMTSQNNSKGLRFADFLQEKYSIGYGARTAILLLGLQVGVLGILGYFYFFWQLFLLISNKLRDNRIVKNKLLGVIVVVWLFVILLDSISYSRVALTDKLFIFLVMFFIVVFLKSSESKVRLNTNLVA